MSLGESFNLAVQHHHAGRLVDAERLYRQILAQQPSDFADTSALIANLDLVICVDTAVAHLAGAMGKPVWTLLPFAPDWRWLLDRETSPWYPTMRLFRQSKISDWAGGIARVVEALRGHLLNTAH